MNTRHLFVKSPNVALTIKQENLKARVFRKVGLRQGIEGKVILKQRKHIPDMVNKEIDVLRKK